MRKAKAKTILVFSRINISIYIQVNEEKKGGKKYNVKELDHELFTLNIK